ncbi:2Fe-2S iron-sulfur cluster-binding protein [Saccharopolyspora karakumensis]|uniref:2Fe-2S iron-sulfur cluster-binding protein n=1 Tax=Saccharopolyspora karakumensis TaxID=2530386 RepID=UPI002E273B96
MLAAAEAAFPADRLHVERFRPRTRTFAPNTAFEAVCARSGRTVPVEADESLLNALRFAGFPVSSGCREGVCGSCELRYLDSEPEHRDEIGAAEGRLYPCVSRSRTDRLTLDLRPAPAGPRKAACGRPDPAQRTARHHLALAAPGAARCSKRGSTSTRCGSGRPGAVPASRPARRTRGPLANARGVFPIPGSVFGFVASNWW